MGILCFFSSYSSNSRGVAILINNNLEYKVTQQKKDNSGNMIALNISIESKPYTFINVYAPNDDNPIFFDSISDIINELDNSRVLIVCDYNLVINPQMDYHNYLHVNNPRARNKVLELMKTYQLTDVYRELHPDDRIYTWRKANPIKQARLDFFLISEPILIDVNQADILSSYRSDHSPVSLSIRLNEFQHGKGLWKFNNSLLEDVIYLDQIKSVMFDTKSQYAVLTYDRNNLDNIPESEIQFTINDQLFLETLLMEIRAKTISYSIFKTRQNKDNEKDLLNDIRKLETRYSENVDLINTKRAELESIREQKLKGSLRSRVKWIEQGEKPTKYFCNLENRNFTSKIIPRVINERNEEITEQNEILRKVEKYYKTLFSQIDDELYQCNLSDEMIGLNYDILDETDKISLEGKISYEEASKTLLSMSNNKSPGSDGFTAE